MDKLCKTLISVSLLHIAFLPLLASAECGSESDAGSHGGSAVDRARALKYKLVAVVSILLAGILGISLPILGGKIPSLRPESNFFFLVKAFAAGVILATGFVHILPEAEENLTSSCLGDEPPWGDFPLTGLIAMVSAILTMMIDSFASGYFKRSHLNNDVLPVRSGGGKENLQNDGHEGHVHVHTHSTHGHSHGSAFLSEQDENIRHKIVSQVLELGILVHSVIIGLSLGTSDRIDTIQPLTVALTFHQLFEGLGLGGCISQARFRARAVVVMVIFFSLTTPVGIGVGIGVSETYDENSPTTLIVSGLLGAMAAGILIYMALVDLLAADFMNPKIQTNLKMLLGCSVSLLLGAGCMSLLAVWA